MTHIALRTNGIDDLLEIGADEDVARSSRARDTRLELALVDGLGAFEALEDEWNQLTAAADRDSLVFQSFNWCWHWCRHYLGPGQFGTQLAIVTGRLGGRLQLVMPLVVEQRLGLKELKWLGEPVSQYGDVIAVGAAASADELMAAWRFAVKRTRADVANLRKVRADATVAPLLTQLRARITAVEEAPYLELAGETTFAGWEERRQPKARKNRRRQARRLADVGPVGFESHAGTAAAAQFARRAVALKRETLAAKGAISPALADPRFADFFADVAHGRGRPAGVTVATITSQGEPAALKVLLAAGRTNFLHIAVFEPRFEKCGAGGLLLEHVVAESIDAGHARLDLLPPRHEYKMEFADGRVEVADHALALTAAGWLYAQGYLGVRRRLKAGIEGLPAPVRRALARLIG